MGGENGELSAKNRRGLTDIKILHNVRTSAPARLSGDPGKFSFISKKRSANVSIDDVRPVTYFRKRQNKHYHDHFEIQKPGANGSNDWLGPLGRSEFCFPADLGNRG